jgi:uncharacterized protein YwgA
MPDELSERMWLVLTLLHFAKGKIYGKIRLQKEVFLCKAEKGVETRYDFDLYKFGPFCLDLSLDLERLEELNLIKVSREPFVTPTGQIVDGCEYTLTPEGVRIVQETILPRLRQEETRSVYEVIEKYNYVPLEKLLQYVYEKYT